MDGRQDPRVEDLSWFFQWMRLKVKEHIDDAFLNDGDLALKNGKRSNGGDLRRPNGMDCAFLNGGDLVLEKWKKSNGGYLRRLKAMECVSFNG